MKHTCHAIGCERAVAPRLLMCRFHWALVPHEMQRAVLDAYRPGQCADKRPSPEWRRAAHDAIDTVALAEGRPAPFFRLRASRSA